MEAQETSYLNGSIICPSLTPPWANLGTISYFFRSFFQRKHLNTNDPLVTTTSVDWKGVWSDPYFWSWLYDFIRNSISKQRFHNSYSASYQLSVFSKQCMIELIQTDLDYSLGMAIGSLQLFSDDAKRDKQFRSQTPVIGFESLSLNELRKIEPFLQSGTGGAILNPMDCSGDIQSYCTALKKKSLELGVLFQMNSRVVSWKIQSNPTKELKEITVSSSQKEGKQILSTITADYFVFATGNNLNDASLEFDDLQVSWPMRGYAIDAPISPSFPSPASPLVCHILADDLRKVYLAPLTPRSVRISGIVDISSRKYSSLPTPAPKSDPLCSTPTALGSLTLEQSARALLLLSSASAILPPNYLISDPRHPSYRFHTCCRPQTIDDLPVIGQSLTITNVYYNGGHGHLGYTRATGSSKLLVELMKKRQGGSGALADGMKVCIPQFKETEHLEQVSIDIFSPQRCANSFLKLWRQFRSVF
jgi:D-amino-acid dehydrogenase